MGQSYCRWSVSQIPFSLEQTEQSEERHCTVGSGDESKNSAKHGARAFTKSHQKSLQLGLLEKIWPERLGVLLVRLPGNIVGCQSDQHIPACVL